MKNAILVFSFFAVGCATSVETDKIKCLSKSDCPGTLVCVDTKCVSFVDAGMTGGGSSAGGGSAGGGVAEMGGGSALGGGTNGCMSGGSCNTNSNKCAVGIISCATGIALCADSATAQPPGTVCGTNQICNAQAQCVVCTDGATCSTGNACSDGATTCNSGAPICVPTAKPPGTACGTGLVCNATSMCQSNDTSLANLTAAPGALVFDATMLMYAVSVPGTTASVMVVPTAASPMKQSLEINGTSVVSGVGTSVTLTGLTTLVNVRVTAESGATKMYAVSIVALGQQAYVKSSNGFTGDRFSNTISISADGFTLAVGAPLEDGSLNSTGTASNAGIVYVFSRSGSTWVLQASLKASNADFGDLFGIDLSLSGDGSTLAVGALGEASSATGINGSQSNNAASFAGAVYIFTRAGASWTQQAYLKASNAASVDQFNRVAMSNDGNTLAVGAQSEDSNATGINGNEANDMALESGAVYVFSRTGTIWSQQAYVKASNTRANAYFGSAVAVSGDGNTMAVSSLNESSGASGVNGTQLDTSAPGSGAVYIFTRASGTWTQQSYVKASNTASSDFFGSAVSLSFNGDWLAVGAPGEDSAATLLNASSGQFDNTAPNAGAVYVFNRNLLNWGQHAYVKASNTGAADGYGQTVALSSDGFTLAVGASGEDSSSAEINTPDGGQLNNTAFNSGAVYVLTRSLSGWNQQAYVKPINTGAQDNFGSSVSLSQFGTALAVGSPYEASSATTVNGNSADNSAQGAGAGYVFTRLMSSWIQQAYLKAPNNSGSDLFGNAIVLSADGNTMAVCSIAEESNATGINGDESNNATPFAGAVYIFIRNGASWSQQAYIKPSNTPVANLFFGRSLSLSADGNTLAVGATGDSAVNFSSGATYIFGRSAGAIWTQQAYLKASNAGTNDQFGGSLALSADGNTLGVGASFEQSNATGINGNQSDNSLSSAGAVYVFTRTSGTWAQQAYVKASNTGIGDYFGWRVSLSDDGNTMAVNAIGESSSATGINGTQADNTATSSGAVYIFSRVASTWTQQAYIKASNTATDDYFGYALQLSGDGNTLGVGAYGEDSAAMGINGNQFDDTAARSGAVYVFARHGMTWAQEAYVKASNTGANDGFGWSLALSSDGNSLFVGAYFESGNTSGLNGNQSAKTSANAGAAYLLKRTGTIWSHQVYLKASNAASGDYFGTAVALSSDGLTMAVGSVGEASNATGINGNQLDNSANFSGAVYVFR
jgi:hypothetical protein